MFTKKLPLVKSNTCNNNDKNPLRLEQFYEYGIQGLNKDTNTIKYANLMAKLIQDFPSLKKLIGTCPIYRQEGNGWGLTLIKTGVTYGLSYQGIQEILNLMGMEKNIIVAETEQKLRDAFLHLQTSKAALITDIKALDSTSCGHAISLFVEKKGNVFRLFINDSMANYYFFEDIQAIVPKGYQLQLVISRVERQKPTDVTCNAFAITDCEAFIKNPNLLTEMQNLMIPTSGHAYEANLKNMPASLMGLEKSEDARKKALDFQLMLMKAHQIPIVENTNSNSQQRIYKP
ncbi:MAG: hypothetical protein H0W64_01305 [Gammaproteobacteria bacterium]|nr:hypothetical protein [Gammaproteobacteria bacterium]